MKTPNFFIEKVMKLKIRKKQRHPKSLFLGIAEFHKSSYLCTPIIELQK
jgi:hypothetical protein